MDKKRMPVKLKLAMPVLKLLQFSELPDRPKKGKFYRISIPECVSANGDVPHGSIRIGAENKVIVMFHGGGVSWNA